MRGGYSRRARVEEKKNIKKAYVYIALSVIAMCLLFFLGLPLIIKFAGFFTNLGKADKPVDIEDITPPAPPQFENIPEFTNKKTFTLEGRSEDGAIITLFFNGKENETVSNSEGKFNFEFNLTGGENTFYAKAKDQSGNEGVETSTYKIVYDNEQPDLEVESPSDGDSFYGASQRQVNINGSTDPTAQVFINDRFVAVLDDGTFSFTTTLSEGINDFNVKAVDKAGNESSTSFSLNFAP